MLTSTVGPAPTSRPPIASDRLEEILAELRAEIRNEELERRSFHGLVQEKRAA